MDNEKRIIILITEDQGLGEQLESQSVFAENIKVRYLFPDKMNETEIKKAIEKFGAGQIVISPDVYSKYETVFSKKNVEGIPVYCFFKDDDEKKQKGSIVSQLQSFGCADEDLIYNLDEDDKEEAQGFPNSGIFSDDNDKDEEEDPKEKAYDEEDDGETYDDLDSMISSQENKPEKEQEKEINPKKEEHRKTSVKQDDLDDELEYYDGGEDDYDDLLSEEIYFQPKEEKEEQEVTSEEEEEEEEEEEAEETEEERRDRELDEQIYEEAGFGPPKTKIITVYSAKGGVGKTTVATELASYLSLVNVGDKRLRVCIVDYNIDFGDVRATLNVKKDNSNLAIMIVELRERLKKSKNKKKAMFSKEELEARMHCDENSGLYILPAPLTNEDSAGFVHQELEFIIDNLKEKGEFDYIICDTGNNTRDSTMIALEKADMILLLLDQNINTANCGESFISTMKAIDFKMDKTRLVINRVMPKKSTTISVSEIIDFFPYKCIGKLDFSTDVIRATNQGEPLAFSPENKFTRQMREIISYILDKDDFTQEDTKKKSVFSAFSKLFGKK